MHTPLALPLSETALVLVDLQKEHRLDARYLVSGYETVLGNAASLLEGARVAGVDIYHIAYVRDFGRVPRRPLEPIAEGDAPTFSDPNGTWTDISPEVAPAAGEKTYEKNDMSSFCEPAFEAEVAARAFRWMIVCGAWTEACVAATVRDAIARGIRVLLVKDACGSGSPAMHQTGVINIANRLYGGAIADTQTTLKLIAGETKDCWQLRGTTALRFDADTIETVYSGL